jgi:hypothetical protein
MDSDIITVTKLILDTTVAFVTITAFVSPLAALITSPPEIMQLCIHTNAILENQ